jgi:hypothetical protein
MGKVLCPKSREKPDDLKSFNPAMTQAWAFHFRNKEEKCTLNI